MKNTITISGKDTKDGFGDARPDLARLISARLLGPKASKESAMGAR